MRRNESILASEFTCRFLDQNKVVLFIHPEQVLLKEARLAASLKPFVSCSRMRLKYGQGTPSNQRTPSYIIQLQREARAKVPLLILASGVDLGDAAPDLILWISSVPLGLASWPE